MEQNPRREPAIDTAAWFAGLSEQLHAEWDAALTPQMICDRVLEVVPAASACGITLRRRRRRLETVAVTDAMVEKWDALQYELDEGPCLDSAQDEGSFLVRDVAHDARWPRWGPKVAELGVGSLISVQMTAPDEDDTGTTLGAINIYSTATGAFDRDDLDRALIFGIHASSALAAAHQITSLESAVQSRHRIGIAQGIVMQRYGLTQERAFEAMQRWSSQSNLKLHAVAEAVIADHSRPGAPPAG